MCPEWRKIQTRRHGGGDRGLAVERGSLEETRGSLPLRLGYSENGVHHPSPVGHHPKPTGSAISGENGQRTEC
jgi:hypothetical protein